MDFNIFGVMPIQNGDFNEYRNYDVIGEYYKTGNTGKYLCFLQRNGKGNNDGEQQS